MKTEFKPAILHSKIDCHILPVAEGLGKYIKQQSYILLGTVDIIFNIINLVKEINSTLPLYSTTSSHLDLIDRLILMACQPVWVYFMPRG